MIRTAALALVLPLLLGAAPPPDPETVKDVRCLVALIVLGNSQDPKIRESALIGAQYFLGRIDGRSPGLDLEAAMANEASMIRAQQKSFLESCGAILTRRGGEVEEIGNRLKGRGI
jgi:hypothetical protein